MTSATGFAAETFLRDVLHAEYIRVKGDEINHKCFLIDHENDYKEPGASLNTEKLLWNCWKCSSGGTLMWITEEVLNINSTGARKLFKEYFESDEIHEETFVQNLEKFWAADPNETMPRYSMRMIEGWMCYTKMMDERGITREVQKQMMTGLNKTNVDDIEVLRYPGSGEEPIAELVQIVQPRIVIPHIFGGKLRGWTMRKADKRQAGNKYKHTRQFPKKSTLYNYDNVKQYDSIFVVESPFSVLSMMSKGFPNTVGTFGAEVNPGQEKLLSKFDEVILFPDGDGPGYRALSRLDKWGKKSGLVHSLSSGPNTWVIDHGMMDEYPYWNGFDAADYSSDEVTELVANKVKALTWDYAAPYEKP